jgi:hypothetical protein
VLKAGFEARRIHLDMVEYSEGRGRMNFTGSPTAARSSGYSFSDFLMGLPASTRETPLRPPVLLKQWEFASFLQDDWRVSPRLTLSLGLRHELYLNPIEDRNRLAFFDAVTGSIVVASDEGALPASEYLPRVTQKLTDAQGRFAFPLLSDREAGLAPRRLLDTYWYYLGPRAGLIFLLDAADKTVLRGGYGLFYSRYPRQYLSNTLSLNPPFSAVFSYTEAFQNNVPAITLDAPFQDSLGTGATLSPGGLDRLFRLPYNQQWQVTLERDVGWSTAVSLGYVGNRGVRLFRSVNVNAPYYDEASATIKRRFSASFGTSAVALRTSDGNSLYHALQAELRRRPKKGLSFQASWTWASGVDDVGATLTSNLLDIENLGRDRAFSDYVRRHNVKLNGTCELPLGKGQRFASNAPRWAQALVGGWRVSGIWQFSTGRYFTATFTGSSGIGNNRPDVVPGISPNLPRGERGPERWFNPAAFADVPAVDSALGAPRFGNAGRNTILGPGVNVLDASLAKKWPFHRGRALHFRLEVFNLLNHPNYGRPDTNISNVNTVATINAIVGSMRKAQLGLRFEF